MVDQNSYFQMNVQRVAKSLLASKPQAFKDMVVSFLTIKEYRYMLLNTHLGEITSDYIDEIMIPDLSAVSRTFFDYVGNDRKGIQEASNSIDVCLRKLYKVGSSPKYKTDALIDCKGKLNEAYRYLEHWNQYAANV